MEMKDLECRIVRIFRVGIQTLLLLMLLCVVCNIKVDAAPLVSITTPAGTVVWKNQTKQITVKVDDRLRKQMRGRRVRWISGNPKVGTVSSTGKFTALSPGKTIIQVQVVGTRIYARTWIEVKEFVQTKSVRFTKGSSVMMVGKTQQLTAAVSPSNATYRSLQWKSSHPSVATISANGKIVAKSVGKTLITVSVPNTNIRRAAVLSVVESVPLKRMLFSSYTRTMEVGNKKQFKVSLTPSNTTYRNIIWASSNKNVATVSSNGVVTAKSAGKVWIAAGELNSRKIVRLLVTITVPVKGVKFTGNNPSQIEFGTKVKFNASVYPANATNKKLIWSTSDSSKATVDANGVVTAIRPTEYVDIIVQTPDKKFKAVYNLQITANTHGFLTKADLDKMGLQSVNKLMIVAHPDDETLWGGSHLIDSDYFVVCLTNGWHKTRVSDYKRVMSMTNDKNIILSYPDTRREYMGSSGWTYDTDTLTTCMTGIRKDLELIINYKNWDEIVTHNPNGEYNKFCHKAVNKLVTEQYNKTLSGKTKLWYFGHYYNKGVDIPGEQISENNLKLKNILIENYLPTAKGAMDAFGQMIPYENWILAENW